MELMPRSSKSAERKRSETWVFTVKWLLSVTPRFLTESDKGTDALPTVLESGKEEETWTIYPRIRSMHQSCRDIV